MWLTWAAESEGSRQITISFLYKRYIDDVLIGHDSNTPPQVIADLLCRFNPNIKVTYDTECCSSGISFLDVLISQGTPGSIIDYRMFRKSMNLYTYIPYTSECPSSVKRSLIDAELWRISRNCRNTDDIDREQQFFKQKLKNRAYPEDLFNARLEAFKRKGTQNLNSNQNCRLDARVVPFKLPYGNRVDQLNFVGITSKHAWKLFSDAKFKGRRCEVRIVNTFLASPNLFRIRYSRFLGADSN